MLDNALDDILVVTEESSSVLYNQAEAILDDYLSRTVITLSIVVALGVVSLASAIILNTLYYKRTVVRLLGAFIKMPHTKIELLSSKA